MDGILNIKSMYSISDSIIKLEELIEKAKELNLKYLGLSDTNLSGYLKFYNLCIKNNIKPLIGLNIKNLDIYAKNYKGLKELFKIEYLKNTNKLELKDLKQLTNNCLILTDDKEIKETFNNAYLKTPINKIEKKEENIESIYTYEIKYLNEDDYIPYMTMLEIHNKKDKDVKNYYYYLKEINYNNEKIQKNTDNFVNQIDLKIEKEENKLEYQTEITDDEYLVNLSKKGLNKRLSNNIKKEYLDRLEKELKVIIDLGFSSYFLVVYDFILYAKKKKILVGPARGSAAGSLVAYSLGITEIDPIEHELIFERFLNKARKQMPDIDTDFPDDKREEVLEYVKNKYGFKNVALIQTFQTLTKKVILNELKRIANGKMDEKLYKDISKKVEDENFDYSILKTKYSYNLEIYNIYHTMERLEGIYKNTSKHAAGVIINQKDLTDKIPTNFSDNFLITEIEDKDLEELGFLKIDFLGIRNLRIIKEILDLIGKDINYLKQIPKNSEKVFKLLNNADTLGIFQLESKGIRELLKKIEIKEFKDIAHTLALYRPGTKDSIDLYLKNKKNNYWIDIDEVLHDTLKETYGVVLYQEQIIKIAEIYAGYTLEEADILRRAISKKNKDIILKEEENFIKHANLLNRDIEKTKEIYNLIVKFADYSFNKSHSVSYATLSYQMSYLKVHHFKEFMVSILNNAIGDQIKTKEYIDYSIERGIEFMGIDINTSTDKYLIKDNKIYIPLTIIKNLGKEQAEDIVKKRKEENFKSYKDFKTRVKVQKPILEKLIYLNAFKNMDETMQEMLNKADEEKRLYIETIGSSYIESKEKIDTKTLKEKELEALGFNLEYDEFKKLKRLRYKEQATKLIDKNIYKKNNSVVIFEEDAVLDDSATIKYVTKLKYEINKDKYYNITYRVKDKNLIIIDYIKDLKIYK